MYTFNRLSIGIPIDGNNPTTERSNAIKEFCELVEEYNIEDVESLCECKEEEHISLKHPETTEFVDWLICWKDKLEINTFYYGDNARSPTVIEFREYAQANNFDNLVGTSDEMRKYLEMVEDFTDFCENTMSVSLFGDVGHYIGMVYKNLVILD